MAIAELPPGWLKRDVTAAYRRVREWRLSALEVELADVRRQSAARIDHLERVIAKERRALTEGDSHG